MSVQFHTQYVRGFWMNCAIGLIPDFLIGVGVAHFTDVGFIAVPVVMIGLPAIAFLLWLKQFPLRVILVYLGREKAIARTWIILRIGTSLAQRIPILTPRATSQKWCKTANWNASSASMPPEL